MLLILLPLPVKLLPLGAQLSDQTGVGSRTSNVSALASAGPHILVVAFLLAPLAMIKDARSRLPILVPPVAVLAALAFVPVQRPNACCASARSGVRRRA
jgi:hypothetical protein